MTIRRITRVVKWAGWFFIIRVLTTRSGVDDYKDRFLIFQFQFAHLKSDDIIDHSSVKLVFTVKC